ncbi:MAG TPA: hypothetical protein VFK03_04070, partial [Candidatus Saccharimonadales bacterium]|nr:hypothetical protein [Candidatus Saccharimonadales bacterium]
GSGTYNPGFIRVTLANPQIQGGAGIQNGTTVQTGNFNLQSSSQTSVTGILKGATSQSADIFEVQDANSNNLFTVGPTGNVSVSGNLSVGGTIGFSNTGNANQALTINENITGSVTAGDVVVIDTANAGYAKDSSSANSTQVVGIATKTQTGGSEPIAISGIYQVNVTGTVNVGDYLVSSSTAGQAQSSSSPTGGVVGQAMGPAVGGKVWARIAPASGAGGGSSGGGLTKLYDVTLGSNTASFDITNIPQTYDSLEGVLVANNDTTSQGNALIRLNNLSSNYYYQYSYDAGTTHTAGDSATGTATSGWLSPLPRSAGNAASVKFTIPNYTSTSMSTHVDS